MKRVMQGNTSVMYEKRMPKKHSKPIVHRSIRGTPIVVELI